MARRKSTLPKPDAVELPKKPAWGSAKGKNGNLVPVPGPGMQRRGGAHNPEGAGTLKHKIRRALNALKDNDVDAFVANLVDVAKGSDPNAAVAAYNAIAKSSGIFNDDEKVQITSFVHVVEGRPRGEPVPLPFVDTTAEVKKAE